MPKFEHDYLIFDEFGEKEILCMSCGKSIKSRSEIVSQVDPSRVIREMSKHADYREIPVYLSDGNIAFIMVCDECKFTEIDEQNARNITNQIQQALASQLRWQGKTDDIIEEILKQIQRRVIRKADIHEVTHALRGV